MKKPPKKTKNNKKEPNSITARMIKTRLLYYYRIERQYPIVCTEGINNSDVTAISKTNLIEVEIKISKSDLIHEFDNPSRMKQIKHEQYTKQTRKSFIIPNQYYICVTLELVDIAKELIQKYNKKYGIMVFKPKNQRYSNIPYGEICVVKNATKLHKEPPSLDIILCGSKRTTSELIQRSMKLYE